MPYEHLLVDCQDHVTRITLNRPHVMNAINPAMHRELQLAFDAFAGDPDQFLCVVTGAGPRAFCAGSDLKAASEGDIAPYPKNGYAGLIERYDLNKPIIAAVNGVCLGGGFEIALACDLIIASENASFGLPEPRIGSVALGGGVHRLARQIGLKRAMGYIFTGDRMTAQDGFSLGLINEVVPADQLDAAASRWSEQILLCSPMALRASKEAVMRGFSEPSLEEAMRSQSTYPAFKAWLASDDVQEGPRAFVEKRAPRWKPI